MSIVSTEIESVHGDASGQRLIFYKCQDHLGVWHNYGPVICNDTNFDADAFMSIVAEKITEQLAEAEFNQEIG